MKKPKERKTPLFGVAGNPPNFWESKYSKERANSPEWLDSIGLDALEIQCTFGVRMPKERAELFKKNSKRFGITLSIHAPYYITLGTNDKKKTDNSINEIIKAVKLAQAINSKRIIFHPGGMSGTREEARALAIKTLQRTEKECDMKDVKLFPEIAGKVGQFGSFEDVLEICKNVKSAYPCLDLAHLHARQHGSLIKKEDFEKVIDEVEKVGKNSLDFLHIHFYPVEWTEGGEKKHKKFSDRKPKSNQLSLISNEDDRFYPRYEPFLDLVIERNLAPLIVCEARDSQDEGALEMKKYYLENK
ncbi:TPA: hypothetical protein DEP90_01380 [Patescibacteria group bacterium]|nr:hypothetical protein [Patescibacteria group bacterium]